MQSESGADVQRALLLQAAARKRFEQPAEQPGGAEELGVRSQKRESAKSATWQQKRARAAAPRPAVLALHSWRYA